MRGIARHHLFAAAAIAALVAPCAAQAQEQSYDLNIPPQDLGSALKALAAATGQQVVFRESSVRGKVSRAVRGHYTVAGAISTLIEGSGLVASRSDHGVFIISPANKADPASADAADSTSEIVVTGSHIRGGDSGSPIHTVTRQDIDNSGYSQVGDVIRSLPENFAGGQNPGVLNISTRNTGNLNVSGGSSANLRGLGSDATLTLLNGHRLAGDSTFQSPDVSEIPLAGISRIEVVTDGASAIYGSDAVAGVMNFIINPHYNGVETSARLGGATDGGGFEQTYNVLAGKSGENGYAMASVQYLHQNPIWASQRDFTSFAPPQTSLLLGLKQISAFGSAGYNISNSTSISLDGLYSNRRTQGDFTYSDLFSTYRVNTPTYNVALTSKTSLFSDWRATLTGVAGGSKNTSYTYYPDYDYESDLEYKNSLRIGEGSVDGTLWHAPTGDVKLALGVGYRAESFRQISDGDNISGKRHVAYAFGEIQGPLVSPSETRTGLHQLVLTLSGRAEHYGDVGRTATPKIAVKYKPFNSLIIRGTWGKSFKAPSLFQLYQGAYANLYDESTLGSAGGGTALGVAGGNPNLKPEKATSWTVGGDYTPAFAKSTTISVTYYSIDFRNRVVLPISPFTTALSDPDFAPFVNYNPTASQVSGYVAEANPFTNYSSVVYDPATVKEIIFFRYANATSQKIHGLDFSYRQAIDLSAIRLNLFANASWLSIDQKTLPTTGPNRLSGHIEYPPAFKARGGFTAERSQFVFTGVLNHIAGETDNGVVPNAHIRSYTTVDLNVSYRIRAKSGILKGLKADFSVSNVFNEAPPYAPSIGTLNTGLYYDSANYSAVGRFVGFTLTKDW